jgi:hypothetical protein
MLNNLQMNLSAGIKWCRDVKYKSIKITTSREEFLLTSKALEIYDAGVVASRLLRNFGN